MKEQVFGLPWFERETYFETTELFEDRHKFPHSYDEWLAHAEQQLYKLEQAHVLAVKVKITPELITTWCNEHGLVVNSNSRKEFAQFIAEQSINHGRLF